MTSTDYGYGSVYQRASDGRWCSAVDLPSERGERRRKVFTGKTREAVEAKLDAFRLANPATAHLGRPANVERARTLGTHTEAQWWALVRASERLCHYCGVEASVTNARSHPRHLEKDHLIPVSRGGSDAIENVVVACRACNMDKGTMTVDEYVNWKARNAQA